MGIVPAEALILAGTVARATAGARVGAARPTGRAALSGVPRGCVRTSAGHRVRATAAPCSRAHARRASRAPPSPFGLSAVYHPRARKTLGAALAAAFLAGPWDEPGLIARGAEALCTRPRWLRRVVRVVLDHYHRPPADRPRELAAFVEVVSSAMGATSRTRPHVRRWFVWEPAMADRPPWAVPELDSVADLGALLGLGLGELA